MIVVSLNFRYICNQNPTLLQWKSIIIHRTIGICFSLIAGTGLSADSPLTVSQALAKKNDRKSYYINGYIVGEYRDYSNNKHFYNIAPPFDGTSAYLIADEIDEIDLSKMMPVQIKDYVDSYNLDEIHNIGASNWP